MSTELIGLSFGIYIIVAVFAIPFCGSFTEMDCDRKLIGVAILWPIMLVVALPKMLAHLGGTIAEGIKEINRIAKF